MGVYQICEHIAWLFRGRPDDRMNLKTATSATACWERATWPTCTEIPLGKLGAASNIDR